MSEGRARVQALVVGARRLADKESELGRRARRELGESTRLSPENIDWALAECLETAPSAGELDALLGSVEVARAVHVVLPANVFVAAHRAIALGLAASARVCVRPSRREPHFARLLAEAAPGLFELVSQVTAEPGDVVWAYGGDASLAAVRASLPPGVALHAQGPGYGLALVDGSAVSLETAAALAADIVPFDQRGCLSPRSAVVLGDATAAQGFARLVARALGELSERIPLGHLDEDERADIARFRDAAIYAGTLLAADPGTVFVARDGAAAGIAPVGRNLRISAAPSVDAALSLLDSRLVTAVGVAGPPELSAAVSRALPEARVSPLGRMQRPVFDGPADRRRSSLT